MNMQKLRWQIAVGALALGVTLASLPAVAQTAGPGGDYFGAGSGPQSGGQPAGTTQSKSLYNSASQTRPAGNAATQHQQPASGPAGPAGANYGAGTNPQNGR